MPAKEDFEYLTKMASEFLGLEGDEHESFVTIAMEKRGHKRTNSWVDNTEDKEKDKNSNVFGMKKSSGGSSGGGSSWNYGTG